MYDLPYYKEKDPSVIKEFIAKHPLALLAGCDLEKNPVVTQVPLLMEKQNVLRGHIMKNTDHHKAFTTNPNVLAVFTGPSTYVSGTWYSKSGIASTWNFMSVHVKGTMRFLDGKGLEDILSKLSLHFESGNRESPTVFEHLPAEFKLKYMNFIVGFEIVVDEIDNVFKLSQDRDKTSYRNIIEKLKRMGPDQQYIAAEMEKRIEELFPKN